MSSKKKFPFWLAVEDGHLIEYAELAHHIAKALHPGHDENYSYAAARINLDSELKDAVRRGDLKVRNRAGLGVLASPSGHVLSDAVLLTDDLRPFVESRGIELRLTPAGSGPRHWTLENAAMNLGTQLRWHDGAIATLQDDMVEAAARADLVVRDPHTNLPMRPSVVRTFYEVVTHDDVNEWLDRKGVSYRWTHDLDERPASPLDAVLVPSHQGAMTNHEETQEVRQARRFQMCLDAGLSMPTNDYASLPRGISAIAKRLGITRQSFAQDVKAHITRVNPPKR